MILPDDILGVIHKFSRPYRTRPDWRSCKNLESWGIHRYWDWHEFLIQELAWHRIRNEYGLQVFQDEDSALDYMRETNMVARLLRFEARLPLELDRLDVLYVWFERNFAMGIAALPMG